jgi:glycine/D-amino acid oxidase-like deaminating enzyme
LLLGGYEPNPVQVEMGSLPAGFEVKDLPLDLVPLRKLAAGVAEQLPILRDLPVHEHRGGLPTMTPDGRQLVGPVPGVAGLYVASGCCVGGLSISPALGEGLAEWILTGRPPYDLDYLGADRFRGDEPSDERLRDACHWQYAHRYTIH